MTRVDPEYPDRCSPSLRTRWWHAQTTGDVSPFNRAVPIAVDRDHHTALNASQTDAALNLRSSGGALVNTDAKLIGVNARPVHVCVRRVCNPKE